MKKTLLTSVLFLFAASTVFAATFTPSPMKLSASPQIHYEFSGNLSIPVTVSGAPGTGLMLVYTKDKANAIGTIKNGFLGWHYMNKVDSCLFVSDPVELSIGSNTFAWSGKDDYGTAVPEGDYTYYMFAYDSKTPKQLASQVYTLSYSYPLTIETQDAQGVKLANPIMYIGGTSKWRIGSDPYDTSVKETTSYRTITGKSPNRGMHIALDPQDHSMVYVHETNDTNQMLTKYQWVPNGPAVMQSNWGTNGIANIGTAWDVYSVPAGAYTDGSTVWASSAFCYAKSGVGTADLFYVDIADGSVLKTLDLTSWYCSVDDAATEGQYNGGPDGIYFRNNILFTQGLEACMVMAVDPYKEDDGDKILWANDNGDYVHDHNFEINAKHPWMCNDYMVGPYTYSISADANNFLIFPCYDMGAVSFGLISGADGTGLDYFGYAGETAAIKYTSQFVDEGTAWDGIYTDNSSTETGAQKDKGVWYVAHDSIKGVISNKVAVAAAAPTSFAVAQNSPNPFNPSTTISFTLAKAGQTTVEVYNVAGQKISTLVNGNLSAGNHTATWNAAKFSAGLYFYTVRSGNFSKTMKMTLLK